VGGITERVEYRAISSSMAVGSLNTLEAGIVRYSANAPGRFTPHAGGIAAQVASSGAAIAAVAARDVAFSGHTIAGVKAADFAADFDDFA